MKHKPLPDLGYLNTILDYNPATGELRWKVKTARKVIVGNIISCVCPRGYFKIAINKTRYQAHRICYYMGTGINPLDLDIDHINLNKSDNRLANLRLANKSQNSINRRKQSNNTSGFKGVTFDKRRNKWSVQITINNKHINLGRYSSKLYAALVYARAAKKHFGEFRRTK